MSDKIPVSINKRMTVQELQDSSSSKNYGKYGHSAFSTADKDQSTSTKANGFTQFKKHLDFASPVEQYKNTLKNYEKQFKQKPVFKVTTYIVPEFHQKKQKNLIKKQQKKQYITNEKKQNQNKYSNGMSQIQQYQQQNNQIQFINNQIGSQKKNIAWKIASKLQSAQVVRNLFGNSGVDYNFQYRKKKFFENFSNKS